MNTKKLLLFISLAFLSVASHAQKVGIGINPPTEKLDVNGNVRFSGALMPNNLTGVYPNVLLSSGVGIAPTWGDGTAGQMWSSVYSTDSVSATYNIALPYVTLPGMTTTINVPSTGQYDAFVYTDGGVQWTSDLAADNASIQSEVSIWYDGGSGGLGQRYQTCVVDNTNNYGNGIRYWSFCYVVSNIPSGSHTFEVKGRVRSVFGSFPTTITFCDKNVVGKNRIGSLSVCLIRK